MHYVTSSLKKNYVHNRSTNLQLNFQPNQKPKNFLVKQIPRVFALPFFGGSPKKNVFTKSCLLWRVDKIKWPWFFDISTVSLSILTGTSFFLTKKWFCLVYHTKPTPIWLKFNVYVSHHTRILASKFEHIQSIKIDFKSNPLAGAPAHTGRVSLSQCLSSRNVTRRELSISTYHSSLIVTLWQYRAKMFV